MTNNYLSVLNKDIIQVENTNVGLNVGGTNIPFPPNQRCWGHMPPLPPPPPPASYDSDIYIWIDR